MVSLARLCDDVMKLTLVAYVAGNPSFFEYTVLSSPLPSLAVTFSVKASNDAHVGLFTGPNASSDMYEIVIGGWSNTQSVIRNSPQGTNRVTARTPGILNVSQWQPFWLTMDGATVTLGTGTSECRTICIAVYVCVRLWSCEYAGVCVWNRE